MAAKVARLRSAQPPSPDGQSMINTPENPIDVAIHRRGPTRSFKNTAARITTNKTRENEIALTWLSGRPATAYMDRRNPAVPNPERKSRRPGRGEEKTPPPARQTKGSVANIAAAARQNARNDGPKSALRNFTRVKCAVKPTPEAIIQPAPAKALDEARAGAVD